MTGEADPVRRCIQEDLVIAGMHVMTGGTLTLDIRLMHTRCRFRNVMTLQAELVRLALCLYLPAGIDRMAGIALTGANRFMDVVLQQHPGCTGMGGMA